MKSLTFIFTIYFKNSGEEGVLYLAAAPHEYFSTQYFEEDLVYNHVGDKSDGFQWTILSNKVYFTYGNETKNFESVSLTLLFSLDIIYAISLLHHRIRKYLF